MYKCPINESMLSDIIELYQALAYMSSQHNCGCNHTACTTCKDDKDNLELLKMIENKYKETDTWKEIEEEKT